MARRGISEDSQKENTGVERKTRVKSEKMRAKETLQNARPQRVETDDEEEVAHDPDANDDADGDHEEDAEGDVDDEEDDQEQSPKGRKRARVNSDGDSVPSGSQPKIKTKRVTLPRDKDGYIPGSIVRIQLRNFVTYDTCEFRAGPYLNMILGPNGTGKSSIACAICLGLNFPPSVLGRAAEITSFVKLGAKEGHIEIELKGAPGKPNVVLKRTLVANSKSSQFTLNGKGVSGKEVNAKMAELNVQVSNLCSFLPQDRVAEFARMSPQQVLRETQRAAGDEHLTAWHDALIALGKELKVLRATLQTDEDQLKNLEERNAVLERDVKRYEERLATERRIALLKAIVPLAEFEELQTQFHHYKGLYVEARAKAKEAKEKKKPIDALKAEFEKKFRDIERQRDEMKASTKRNFQDMKKMWTKSENMESELENYKANLGTLKTKERNRLKDIQKAEKTIASLQNQVDNPTETEPIEPVRDELKSVKSALRKCKDDQDVLHGKQHEYITKSTQYQNDVHRCTHSLTQLNDESHRKLEVLRKADSETAAVVEWLRDNRSRFKMEIMEPAILSVDIPDLRFKDAIEAAINLKNLKTFVAQCEEDYREFNRLVVDTPQGMGRKYRVTSWYRGENSVPHPIPMSEEEMRALGFDGYAINHIQYPTGLDRFLRLEVQLHRVPIAISGDRVDFSRAMDAGSRAGQCTFITGNTMNQVSRSKYGQRLPQNQTNPIPSARFLIHPPIDPEVKRECERRLAEAQFQLNEVKRSGEAFGDEEKAIRERHGALKQQEQALADRERVIIDTRRKFVEAQAKLGREQRRLSDLQNSPSVDVERSRLKSQILRIVQERVKLLVAYEKLSREIIREQTECTRLGLQHVQISANKAYLNELCDERVREYEEAGHACLKAKDLYVAAKTESKAKLNEGTKALEELPEDLQPEIEELQSSGGIKEKSAEEWKEEAEAEAQKLQLTGKTNSSVVDQYKQRANAIDNLRTTIEEAQLRVNKKEKQIKSTRDNWEPALKTLVESVGAKFSSAFDRIGCAGEIKVTPHEDYDKWAIDIMVKFRDHEKLQLLTGERQSGGERSLTTIMYLMSLTEQARTPFSLVDEINQGMDARAERAVHNSLVEVTCRPDSTQYFLITPKLLPDLMYHERMKVLCVNNGEWLPEDALSGNMMGMIDNWIQFKATNLNGAA